MLITKLSKCIVLAALALRGLKDTVVPLWLAALGYWGFGICCGWILAFPFEMGAEGLWWGMAVGLTVTGTLLAYRFHQLTRDARHLESQLYSGENNAETADHVRQDR